MGLGAPLERRPAEAAAHARRVQDLPEHRGVPVFRRSHDRAGHELLVAQPDAHAETRTGRVSLDRKSTRLNSSHGYISYAVFCLKKKKNTHISEHTLDYNSEQDNEPTQRQ